MLSAIQAESTNQKFINVVPQFECWVKHQRAIKGLRDDAEEQSRTVMDSLNKAKKTKKKYKAKVKDLEQEVEALNDKLVLSDQFRVVGQGQSQVHILLASCLATQLLHLHSRKGGVNSTPKGLQEDWEELGVRGHGQG